MTIASRVPLGLLALEGAALDRLMPLHLRLDATGIILGTGPTLAKLLADEPVLGRPVGSLFALRRPALPTDIDTLRPRVGSRIHLALLPAPDLLLRGLAVEVEDGGLLLNLSFGIWITEAVRRFGLTVADFAATDLTVEMLYLVEAKSAVMEELRNLNLRLNGAKEAAEEQALTDTLTGLRNRRALDLRVAALIAQGQPFALVHLDLDYFKQVNDTLGHAAGDHVLRQVACILREETRAVDLVARVGGDEFVLVFAGLGDPSHMEQLARRIIDRLSEPMTHDGQICRISGSIGMTHSALYQTPAAHQMHADADEALYAAKHAGRGQAKGHWGT